MKYVITVEGETFEIEVGHGRRVWVNRHPYDVDFQGVDGLSQYSLLVDNRSYEAHVEQADEEGYHMVVAGRPYRVCLQRKRRGTKSRGAIRSRPPTTGEVRAPLSGLLVAVPVAVGQRVAQGKVVAVLESMKMNLELCTPWDGVVQALHRTPGTVIGQGQVLAVIGTDGR